MFYRNLSLEAKLYLSKFQANYKEHQAKFINRPIIYLRNSIPLYQLYTVNMCHDN